MFTRSIPLFNLFGFQVKLDPSWFFLAILLIWTLSTGLFPYTYPLLTASTHFWMSVAVVFGLFASIVLHEFAHSWVAGRFGLPMRGITLFIFGGVAEMSDDSPSPAAEFWMAIAGPAASVLILLVCLALSTVGMLRDWPLAVVGVTSYLAVMNGILIIFNLIPAFPLDGGRVLRALLWQWKKNLKWATRITAQLGGWFGVFLILLGIWDVFRGLFLSGIWQVLIGLFLRQAADVSYQQVLIRRQLEGEPVSRFMQTAVISVASSLTVQDLVENYFYRFYYKGYPVIDQERPVGHISLRQVQELPTEEWKQHTVAELMQPVTPDNTIAAQADATEALAKMTRTGNSQLMVTDNEGGLAGLLSIKELLRFFSMKIALEESNPPSQGKRSP